MGFPSATLTADKRVSRYISSRWAQTTVDECIGLNATVETFQRRRLCELFNFGDAGCLRPGRRPRDLTGAELPDREHVIDLE